MSGQTMQFIYFKYSDFKENWRSALQSKNFKWNATITLFLLIILLSSLSYFFTYIETRTGTKMADAVLQFLPSHDVSLLTFVIIYSSALLCIINLLSRPAQFIQAVQAYFLILLLRLPSIYFLPLEAPEGIIPLQDPFVETFFYGHTRITKDLFFSGHVATVFLLYLANPYKQLKYFYGIVVVVVAFLILLQHAHYTLDVVAAPLFTWLCFLIPKYLKI